MTSTAVAMLPTGSDPGQWSPEEKALVEAAGLVAVDARSGEKTPAPRPVVAAFLQHAARTGLDPFARQIYCLARKSKGEYKWTTQISIDGARLVAERTGQYEGQTTPEFTADGVTWTEVWLSNEMPRAARVGVFRRGFREALYAVALWDAYAVYQDEWKNGSKTGNQSLSAMWAKMGPLMLAKCAEMLALRKAFPQDLSGLYSTEEMDQAGGPREVVRQAERPAQELRAEVVEQTPIVSPVASRDWRKDIDGATTLEATSALYKEAEAAGELGIAVGMAGDNDDGTPHTVMDLFWFRKRELETVTPTLVDVPAKTTGKRQWVREARAKKTRSEVQELHQQAIATGAPVGVIDELEAIANTLPDPEAKAPETSSGWAVAQIPNDAGWTEPTDADAPPADDEPAVFDSSIGGES